MFAVLFWLLLGVGQASDAVERYRYSVDVETSDVASTDGSLPGGSWHVSGELTVEATHRNRDGSVSLRVSLVAVDGRLGAGEEAHQAAIQGRSFGMRVFEDGEVLDVSDGAYISGWDHRGDLIDVLLPLLSPAPPKLKGDAPVRRRLIWPFRAGEGVRWDNAVEAQWHREVPTDAAGRQVLKYQGPYQLDGWDKRPGGKLVFDGDGTLSGVISVGESAGWRHSIEMRREVRVTVGSAAPLVQRQHIRGSVERIDGAPVKRAQTISDRAPLARYLQFSVVQPIVQGLPGALLPCGVAEDLTLPVVLEIAGDGQVSAVVAESLPECVQQALSALQFPAHDGPLAKVRFTVYARGGRIEVSPVAELVHAPVGPVLIHPLGQWSEVQRRTMAAALGHPQAVSKPSQR